MDRTTSTTAFGTVTVIPGDDDGPLIGMKGGSERRKERESNGGAQFFRSRFLEECHYVLACYTFALVLAYNIGRFSRDVVGDCCDYYDRIVYGWYEMKPGNVSCNIPHKSIGYYR